MARSVIRTLLCLVWIIHSACTDWFYTNPQTLPSECLTSLKIMLRTYRLHWKLKCAAGEVHNAYRYLTDSISKSYQYFVEGNYDEELWTANYSVMLLPHVFAWISNQKLLVFLSIVAYLSNPNSWRRKFPLTKCGPLFKYHISYVFLKFIHSYRKIGTCAMLKILKAIGSCIIWLSGNFGIYFKLMLSLVLQYV